MWGGHGKTVPRMDIFDNSIRTGGLSGWRVVGQARGGTIEETDNTKCLLKSHTETCCGIYMKGILKKSPVNEETMFQLNILYHKEKHLCQKWAHLVESQAKGVSETLPNITYYYQGYWSPSTTCF